MLVDYGERKGIALLDSTERWKFNNYSILVGGRRSVMQNPHIDLQAPQVQFAMAITDAIPGTKFAVSKGRIKTGLDIAKEYRAEKYRGDDIGEHLLKLVDVIDQSASEIICKYGDTVEHIVCDMYCDTL